MNKAIIFLVGVYHLIFRSNIASCRYTPTCSQYLIDAIQKHGTVKGVIKTTQRIISCQPLSKRPLYDPV